MKSSDEYGKFTGPAEVRLVRTLPGPIERIWEFLTDPEKRARWFASGLMEQRVGGKVQLSFRHKDLAPDEITPEDCIVTCWEPPRVLAFTFGSDGESKATFELTVQGKNVLLVLTHRATGGDVPNMSSFGAGWRARVTLLIALLEGAPRPPFWSLLGKLKADYGNSGSPCNSPEFPRSIVINSIPLP